MSSKKQGLFAYCRKEPKSSSEGISAEKEESLAGPSTCSLPTKTISETGGKEKKEALSGQSKVPTKASNETESTEGATPKQKCCWKI